MPLQIEFQTLPRTEGFLIYGILKCPNDRKMLRGKLLRQKKLGRLEKIAAIYK